MRIPAQRPPLSSAWTAEERMRVVAAMVWFHTSGRALLSVPMLEHLIWDKAEQLEPNRERFAMWVAELEAEMLREADA